VADSRADAGQGLASALREMTLRERRDDGCAGKTS
jgi:hypothetical protein